MSETGSTLRVTIIEGRQLKDADIVGQNDAFVEVYLDKKYKQRTKTIQNSNNPVWNETFTFNVGKHDDELHFNVYDEDVAGKDSIGSTKIDLKKHDFSRSAYDAWIKLPALLGLRSNGEIHVKVEYHA